MGRSHVGFFMTLDQLLCMLPPRCHQTEAMHSTELVVLQFFLCYPPLVPILLLIFFPAFKVLTKLILLNTSKAQHKLVTTPSDSCD